MLKVGRFTCEGLSQHSVIDKANPVFAFSVESDQNNVQIQKAIIRLAHWKAELIDDNQVTYDGPSLQPFTSYQATLSVTTVDGEHATASLSFETGFLSSKWQGRWITDGQYRFTEKHVSPKPMVFKKAIAISKKIKNAKVYMTALGIYDVALNGEKVGKRYFAPGFTSYKTHLQYQTYDLTSLLLDSNILTVTVAGGWAVGSFIFTRQNRVTAPRQALLGEIHLSYEDGTKEIVPTDTSWDVSLEGPVLLADFYDGETFDARIDTHQIAYHSASLESIKIKPTIEAEYGSPVIEHEIFTPVEVKLSPTGKRIYDFGQNFAGIVHLKIKSAKDGQRIAIRHAEILTPDGELNTVFLRSAKATTIYIAHEGYQEYHPTFTYMGFRYVGIEGIDLDQIEVTGIALYSDIDEIGDFECSNPLLNQLQSNIKWSAKSNFVDIPTDCPQRDERMGWTGDIALFAPTACFNFDVNRFLHKWLYDLQAEQRKTGGIPNTIPAQGYGFPATMPVMAIDFWGDAALLVPWTLFRKTGDKTILVKMYETMRKYVDACAFWARLVGVGKNRYIWHTPAIFHFGDWVAPDVPKMSQWQGRSRWTATASLRNTSLILSKVAEIIGYVDDTEKYRAYSGKVADAYVKKFTDGLGKLHQEFQTGYVLPLYFDMFNKEQKQLAATHLVRLVEKGNYCIGTGFPGTPYILFALADNGFADIAYKMLLNTVCPSWLYEVKVGGTTIWERWDGLDEHGQCPIANDGTGGMISFNHYASGAVGDFLYRRVAGIEEVTPGYRSFKVKPLVSPSLTYARAFTRTPFGKLSAGWKVVDNQCQIDVEVPIGCTAEIIFPNGKNYRISNGHYHFVETL